MSTVFELEQTLSLNEERHASEFNTRPCIGAYKRQCSRLPLCKVIIISKDSEVTVVKCEIRSSNSHVK